MITTHGNNCIIIQNNYVNQNDSSICIQSDHHYIAIILLADEKKIVRKLQAMQQLFEKLQRTGSLWEMEAIIQCGGYQKRWLGTFTLKSRLALTPDKHSLIHFSLVAKTKTLNCCCKANKIQSHYTRFQMKSFQKNNCILVQLHEDKISLFTELRSWIILFLFFCKLHC